jgi:hypothetical protein
MDEKSNDIKSSNGNLIDESLIEVNKKNEGNKNNKEINNPPKKNNKYRYAYIANPPRKENDQTMIDISNNEKKGEEGDNFSYNGNNRGGINRYDIDDKNSLKNSERKYLNNEPKKSDINKDFKDEYNDVILERLDYNGFKKYKEKNSNTIFSVFMAIAFNNNTLAFAFIPDENDFFIKSSVLILAFSLYLLFNIIFMTNNLSLHLYKDRDQYLHENLNGREFLLMNILLPFIVYICVLIIRKSISVKEFLQQKEYELNLIGKNGNIGPKEILKLHSLQTSISIFKNKNIKHIKNYFYAGLAFLLFTWYLTTCFCGIYENSVDCLILNIFLSIIFSLILTLVLFFISSILRVCAQNKNVFAMSTLFNPTKLLFGEIKTNYPRIKVTQ